MFLEVTYRLEIYTYQLANSFQRINHSHSGGGIEIFVKNGTKFKPIKLKLSCDLDVEVEGIEIFLGSLWRVAFIGLYSPLMDKAIFYFMGPTVSWLAENINIVLFWITSI